MSEIFEGGLEALLIFVFLWWSLNNSQGLPRKEVTGGAHSSGCVTPAVTADEGEVTLPPPGKLISLHCSPKAWFPGSTLISCPRAEGLMGFIPRHTCSDLEKGGLTWTPPPLGTERVGKNLTSPIPDPGERWALALVLEPRAY